MTGSGSKTGSSNGAASAVSSRAEFSVSSLLFSITVLVSSSRLSSMTSFSDVPLLSSTSCDELSSSNDGAAVSKSSAYPLSVKSSGCTSSKFSKYSFFESPSITSPVVKDAVGVI